MTVYWDKRLEKYRYHFQLDGVRHHGICLDAAGAAVRTKTEAKAIELQARAAIPRADKRMPAPAADYSFAQACAAVAQRNSGKAAWPNQKAYLRELIHYFGPATPIGEITTQRVWDYIAFARAQPIMIWHGGSKKPDEMAPAELEAAWQPAQNGRLRADATINRYLDTLRQALTIAHQARDAQGRRLFEHLPEIPELREMVRLPRPIADANLARIVAVAPAHLADAVQLVRNMGFRKAEVFALTTSQVDHGLKGVWLTAEATKGDRDEFVEANPVAWALLQRLVDQAKERGVDHLISYRRGTKNPGPWMPVKNPKRAWRTCLRTLGLEGQHVFHNTKASFVTSIAVKASEATTRKLARHKDSRTTDRYIQIVDIVRKSALDAIAIDLVRVNAAPTCTPPVAHQAADGGGAIANLLENMVGATGFEPATPRPPV